MKQTSINFPRAPIVRAYLGDDDLIVDFFAGGGGASSALEQALGRSPTIAVNHDRVALDMHAANHPDTEHLVEDVYRVDPVTACRGRKVGAAWFSPTCTFFSKARGAPLSAESIKIRALCWVAARWAAAVKPRVIFLENVEEFSKYGPLHKQHTDGCTGGTRERKIDGRSRETQGCRSGCRYLKPIKAREGETFRAFVRRLKSFYRHVEWRLLKACDFGAPTTRRRLFLIASDQVITWPEPTHGPGRALPYRTAAEVIDWSIPCPSIFDRERPLADKTLARIARGVRKFVLESASPFVIPVNHGGVGRTDLRVHDLAAPLPTITGGQRGGHALVAPYLVHVSNGERVGQAPRIYDPRAPLGTVVAQGNKHAVCAAFLAKHYSDRPTGGFGGGEPLDGPVGALTATNHHSLVAAHLVKFYGTSTGADLGEPAPTVTAGGWKLGQVCAFLSRYNGGSVGQPPGAPLGTLDTTDRYALVTVTIDGEPYVIVDIGMRMLTPRELYLAQGFPPTYQIDRGASGDKLTKTAQIRMCGNSVSPPPAIAAIRAQLGRAA